MTILYSAAPGSASRTFKKHLEIILNCNSVNLKSGSGIGHLLLNISAKRKIIKKLKLDFFFKSPLIYGHIFPTKHNFSLLNLYYDISHIIVSYRNIYEQLNYFYKWQKYLLRAPLSFPEDENFSKKENFNTDDFNIDLTLLLVLNYYKHWFYLAQNNKIKNITLISFEEIINLNGEYKQKIKHIFRDLVDVNKLKFDT